MYERWFQRQSKKKKRSGNKEGMMRCRRVSKQHRKGWRGLSVYCMIGATRNGNPQGKGLTAPFTGTRFLPATRNAIQYEYI